MENITQTLRQYILDEFIAMPGMGNFEPNYPLVEEGIIDSLGIFVLADFIERRFGIKIQREEIVLDNFENLETLSAFVGQKIVEHGRK